jgi:hypothetical protein
MVSGLNSFATDSVAGLVQMVDSTELDNNSPDHVISANDMRSKLQELNYNIVPITNDTYTLGTDVLRFKEIHVTDVYVNGSALAPAAVNGVTLDTVQTITANKTFTAGVVSNTISCSEFDGSNPKFIATHNYFGNKDDNDVTGSATYLHRFKQNINTTPYTDATLVTAIDWATPTAAIFLPKTLSGQIVPVEQTCVVTLFDFSSVIDAGTVFDIPVVVSGAVATITPAGAVKIRYNGAQYTSLTINSIGAVKLAAVKVISTGTMIWMVLSATGTVTGIP